MTGPRGASLIALLAACLLAGATAAEGVPSREYQIKASFLLNFARFTEWPASAFADAQTPLRIGVLGEDPFGPALDETVRGERLRERALVVLRSRRVEDLAECHLVFIALSEKARMAELIAAFAAKPVLTVSELEGFAEAGGAIRFYLSGKKVRFEINQEVTQRHELRLNPQLLSLGRIVGARPPEAP